jgi:hypothetical protein
MGTEIALQASAPVGSNGSAFASGRRGELLPGALALGAEQCDG